ncbi:MAG: peptide ABC transporter permease [Gemmatimonadetes bacterium]|nr:MAG: peptide ABC transporter permease [Gemmatimonadota bacterium]
MTATASGRRFFRHPTAVPGLFVLAFFVTIAIAAPVVAPYPPYFQIDITNPDLPPSTQFLLGTDPYSRDVWSRLVYGARVSLGIGAVAMLVAATIGTAVGAVAGYFRRWVDTALMRLVDVGLAMPRIFVLLMAVALWEHIALWVLVLLIGLTGWFGTSRLVRAEVLSLRERDFVVAARAAGAGSVLLEAGLSFLGLGVPPPAPSWGNMIADGWHKMTVAWWASTFPGLAISLVVMAFNALGDALRDALDPRRAGEEGGEGGGAA